MKEGYNFQKIEEKWQKTWEKNALFECEENPRKKKYYCLEMYPYPSGKIHMGQIRNYTIGDVIARYKRMKGLNVLHPIGWDAFGMPAENAAIKKGIHPQKWTLENISHMKSQLKRLGFSYDWSREVNTCLPEYYKWNQWIFLKLLENGLAYKKNDLVNWCPQCKTVLANEQVIGDKCWRCDSIVEQKEMEQWFLKITDYAEELLSGHKSLEKWSDNVLTMQKNWIGKSTGAHISFPILGSSKSVEIFTTRIDTIFGATFLVLSPEHPLSKELSSHSGQKDKLNDWIERNIRDHNSRKEPGEEEKEGVDTGKKAINPFTGEEIPIWIANYVLMDYGTGAIMAVPAHDQRDFEFARKYSLPIKEVIIPQGASPAIQMDRAFEDHGILINSGPFSGRNFDEAEETMIEYTIDKKFGRRSTLYRLRDWGVSRQRYWGTPIPVIYCDKCGIVGVPYEDLPVTLPVDVEFKREEGSPLEKSEAFVKTICPKCNREARRETDTMDTFFDSSWYFFRYCSPVEGNLPFDKKAAKYWLPVDLYIGGVEHAILHLIYARFFCKFLRDFGLTNVDEPFPHLLSQGMVIKDGVKMSKSKGNVVDPDEIVKKYGADTLRLFILFAAPPEKEFIWDEKGIEGCFRFLSRMWTFFQENRAILCDKSLKAEQKAINRNDLTRVQEKMHQTIRKVSEDIQRRYHLNTAISSLMEFFNLIKSEIGVIIQSSEGKTLLKNAFENLILLLSPFAPHICEEIWERIGKKSLIVCSEWPSFDPELAKEEMVTIVVQINGKLRDRLEVERDLPECVINKMVMELTRIKKTVRAKEVKKIIYIDNRLVNIVI